MVMTRTPTMKALVIDRANAPFRLAEVPRPAPDVGQLLIRIHASGVNPLDTKIRAGLAAHARQPLPAILGVDLAGVVEEVGPRADTFRRGDEVWGLTGGVGGLPGSLAELAAVDAAVVARKPARLSMREAAALPLVAITAWEGLVDRANVRAGQKVLIHGGAGGVGHVAIQIARARGAEVFATVRARDADYVRSLGATPIDYEQTSVDDYVVEHTAGRGFAIVFDTVGSTTLEASFAAVARYGHVVSSLGWGTHPLSPLSVKGASFSGVFSLIPLLTGDGRAHHGAILGEIAQLAHDGKLIPRLDPRSFALDNKVADAYEAITTHRARGKLVVSIVQSGPRPVADPPVTGRPTS